ncbi:uncharacterized protein N7506_011318 [Penicillium brevicompactum]|uniref:uncharacterized protein n=1 Tax=Penicillium brevicompactum TaxID=5074 RepID=UPI0025422B2C|nr:uncharacterized protein N7506_011318 [Penicillium brevicompactum]KAJ5322188.1 hypothetical protein N7506_011318 [Penicillium brevicompactum]
MTHHTLEADDGQEICHHETCLICGRHFLTWQPARIRNDPAQAQELLSLLQKAASIKWSAKTRLMAGIIKMIETGGSFNLSISPLCIHPALTWNMLF